MTPFSALLAASGLSQREAAEFLAVGERQIRKWVAGESAAPPAVLREIAALIAMSSRAAEEMRDNARQGAVVRYPADDEEAADLGFPSLGAWRAMAGRMLALADDLDRIRFAPVTDAHGH